MEAENQNRISKEDILRALRERHGKKIQDRLSAGRVAIAGLGGLGSNVAVSLARIGVGNLHLVDFDRVDITNLNRQQYFIGDIGKYKTESLRETLSRINPWLHIRTDCVRISSENAAELFREDEIVCEAFDVPESKAMLVNTILEQCPGKILVAASGMAGYGRSNEIRTRKVGRNFYLCGDEVSESKENSGLMAPRVMICAGHEANLIAELIIGGKDSSGKRSDSHV